MCVCVCVCVVCDDVLCGSLWKRSRFLSVSLHLHEDLVIQRRHVSSEGGARKSKKKVSSTCLKTLWYSGNTSAPRGARAMSCQR
jgi:hypothetical protein